ncbi:MAG: hypothetical protein JWM70_1, partial [Microbacteriaceae bacterium]|nr:hypothetical protein [Microbacteriaceae bacterium]
MAAVGLVAAGCVPVEPTPTKSPSATPIGPPDWAALGTALTGKLLRPGDVGYDI